MASQHDLGQARAAVALTDERGYGRDRNLVENFDALLEEFGGR